MNEDKELSKLFIDVNGMLSTMVGSIEAYVVGYFENKHFGDGFKLIHK